MDVQFDEVFENVMMNAIIAACDGNGVLDGLAVSENGAGASMHVDVAAGNAWIGGTKYTEGAITENLVITAAHATLDRKDLVTYDPTTSNPIVTTGVAASPPEPPDIPVGDNLLAIVDVAAAVTQITNADITDGRVIVSTASDIPNTPAGDIVATDVQAAIDELDAEKLSSATTHGVAAHTNVTRELWVPATYGTDGLGAVDLQHVGAVLADAAIKDGYAEFKVPTDFVSGGILKAVVIPSGTGNLLHTVYAKFGSNGESCAAHVLSTSETAEAVTDPYMEVLNNTLTLSGIAEGDIVGGRFNRRSTHASDTINADVHFLGFIFEYLGEQ